MRRGLFLFLIVLTTLRGLVGPAMATSMVLPQPAAVAAHHGMPHDMAMADATMEHGHHADMVAAAHAEPADCHTPAPTAADAHCASSAPHAACADCDICHTAVVAPVAFLPTVSAGPASRPDLRSDHFASAAPALVTKPPIS